MQAKLSVRAHNALLRTDSKSVCLRALIIFAAQNPGFEWGNYCTGNYKESLAAYRGDSRPVSKQWREIVSLLWLTKDLTDADLIEASKGAFSGRLTFIKRGESWGVDYCAGQYWPTEYRLASLAVLKAAIAVMQRRFTAQKSA